MGRALVQPQAGVDYFEIISTVVMGAIFEGTEAELREAYPEIADTDIEEAKRVGTNCAEISDAFGYRNNAERRTYEYRLPPQPPTKEI